MADNPNDPNNTAEVLAEVKQQRLEDAVDELMAAEKAGTLGKPREQSSRSDAHEANEEALADEFEKASLIENAPAEQPLIENAPGEQPLITNAPGEQPLIQEQPHVPPWAAAAGEAALKLGDAYMATRTGVPDVATLGAKAVQNVIDAREAEGPRAAAARFASGMAYDAAAHLSMPPGAVDINQEILIEDAKAATAATSDAFLGDPPSDEGPVS